MPDIMRFRLAPVQNFRSYLWQFICISKLENLG